ncbi:MAG: hypothetical protein ACK5NT_07295 [Pyrinomonadaceae bacterium]
MGSIKNIKKSEIRPTTQPSLHGRAMDNLEFIRGTMERTTRFTAVPGFGGALMGLTAIGASVIAAMQTASIRWLAVWMLEALLAFLIGLAMMHQKSRIAETSLTSAPARKFGMGFIPPILAGIIVTFLLLQGGQFSYLPAAWLAIYGAAVVTGGAYSVAAVPVMGWMFIALGAVASIFPQFGNYFMGIGFGGLHIVFGIIIARRYGG